MKKNLTILTSVCLVCLGQAQYKITDLGVLPGASTSIGVGINESGSVAGTGSSRAFYWTMSDGMQEIVGARRATGINDSGQIAGTLVRDFINRSYFWDPVAGITEIPDLPGGGEESLGADINNHGQVIGYGNASSGIRGFIWDSINGITDLGDLPGGGDLSVAIGMNNSGQVVGYSNTATNSHAFLWDSVNGMQDIDTLPAVQGTFAYAINDSGTVVGYTGTEQGFIWDANNGMQILTDIPGGAQQCHVYDINSSNIAVGFGSNLSGQVAAVWGADRNIIDLNTLVVDNPSGLLLEKAHAINDLGMITGEAITPDFKRHAFLATPVPEPGVFMGLAGFPLLVKLRRLKKFSKQSD